MAPKTDNEPSKLDTFETEVKAMRSILRTLEKFDGDTQVRILHLVAGHLGHSTLTIAREPAEPAEQGEAK